MDFYAGTYFIFKNLDIEEIPEKYILRRWKRDIIHPGMRTRRTRCGESSEECKRMGNELFYMMDNCIGVLGQDEQKLAGFVEKIRAIKEEIMAENTDLISKNKDEVIEQHLGVSKPSVIIVENSPILRYKWCGKDNRLKSARETAMEDHLKPKRNCGRCGIMINKHDKRNCEKIEAKQARDKQLAETLESVQKI